MGILRFLQYNNAVPVAISVVLIGGASAFAASDPSSIYSQTQTVLSVDNTYLVGKDLSSYSPRAEILGVTEDADNYYVAYRLYTIDLDDYVWKDVIKNETMKVSKEFLGKYRDLGVYVTEQLKENIANESRRLAETQAIEKKNVSQKVVATTYGGLVGKFLDESTETIAGYTPIVQSPSSPEVASAAAADTSNPGSGASGTQGAQSSGPTTIQILGGNPAYIAKGTSYIDLGAAITGPTDADRALGIHIFVNDSSTEVLSPVIDTSELATWKITYKVTNQAGMVSSVTRTVIVYDPNDPEAAAAALAAMTAQQQQAAPPAPPAPTQTQQPAPQQTQTQTETQTTETNTTDTQQPASDAATTTPETPTPETPATETTPTDTASSTENTN